MHRQFAAAEQHCEAEVTETTMLHRSALHAARIARRGLHTTRTANAGAKPWGTEVNEPGGRLFGEKIRAPGERRVPFDWELPYLGTMGLSVVILYFGIGSRPNKDVNVWAREEAMERAATKGKK